MSKEEIQRSVTLTQFILRDMQKHPEATGQLTILLHAIEIACKYISSKVRAAGLLNLYGVEGSVNVQGEIVKRLDTVSNDAFTAALKRSHTVCLMVSEENEHPILVEDAVGHYLVAFDPLDGSSNIDVNVSIGTIFAIYRKPDHNKATKEEILQPGNKLVSAGYCVYGSATIMVLTTGNGVSGFTLDPSTGEFVLSHPYIRIPDRGNIYSINEGYSKYWYDPIKNYINKIKDPSNPKEVRVARYVGSMVADVHRTLINGGIFLYPNDKRNPEGKLRLLYEANPMSMLIEQAGGKSFDGKQRILDIQPSDIHQRTPIFLGSKENIAELESFFQS